MRRNAAELWWTRIKAWARRVAIMRLPRSTPGDASGLPRKGSRATFFLAMLLMTGCLNWASPALAVTVAPYFTDHLVLQREMKNRIWGSRDGSEAVQVQLSGAQAKAKPARARTSGSDWDFLLPALPAGGPYVIRIIGAQKSQTNEVLLSDVWVGEVWLIAGSSQAGEMPPPMDDADASQRLLNRFRFQLLSAAPASLSPLSLWQLCDRASGKESNLSSIAYFLGRRLIEDDDIPCVGILQVPPGNMDAWKGLKPVKLFNNPNSAAQKIQQMSEAAYRKALEAHLTVKTNFEALMLQYKRLGIVTNQAPSRGLPNRLSQWHDGPLEGLPALRGILW